MNFMGRLLDGDDGGLRWVTVLISGIIRQRPVGIAEPAETVVEDRGTAIESDAAGDSTTAELALPRTARSEAASARSGPGPPSSKAAGPATMLGSGVIHEKCEQAQTNDPGHVQPP